MIPARAPPRAAKQVTAIESQYLILLGKAFLTTTVAVPASKQRGVVLGFAFMLLTLITLALFLIPAWIIQPFKYQAPRALSLAMNVRQIAPWVTVATLALALLCAVQLWQGRANWKKALLVFGLVLSAAAAVMSRIDYFEWMFHPVAAPGFQSVADSKLDPGEMVMAVRFGNDARAYPIRAMAYHHVVNDVVNGVPITVTY